MYTMGVDIGSASSKIVILKDKELFAFETVQLGTGTQGPEWYLKKSYIKQILL